MQASYNILKSFLRSGQGETKVYFFYTTINGEINQVVKPEFSYES